MAFVIFIGKSSRGHFISLGKMALLLPMEAYAYLKNPRMAEIHFDKERKAIKIMAGKGQKVTKIKRNGAIATKLSTVMPVGRYWFDKGVYVYQPNKTN